LVDDRHTELLSLPATGGGLRSDPHGAPERSM